jgi:hypothetical protein
MKISVGLFLSNGFITRGYFLWAQQTPASFKFKLLLLLYFFYSKNGNIYAISERSTRCCILANRADYVLTAKLNDVRMVADIFTNNSPDQMIF